MKHKHSRKPAEQIRISKERIEELFRQAEKAAEDSRMDLANRYVTLARKIAMKFKVKIPPKLKRKFCRHCYKYLKPGVNARVRTHKGRVIYYCDNCRNYMRFVIRKK
ncbi:ribonuclease P [Candidatus Woesearchaeota archaeon]|nr:ribonuclease P [Candidatus Woesearchaeota archaeon]